MEHETICVLRPVTLDEARELLDNHLEGSCKSAIGRLETRIEKLRRITNPPLGIVLETSKLEQQLTTLYADSETITNLYEVAMRVAGIGAVEFMGWIDGLSNDWLEKEELAEIPYAQDELVRCLDGGTVKIQVWQGYATAAAGDYVLNVWLPNWWRVAEGWKRSVMNLHDRLRGQT
jgi:hypothetical protein